MLQNHQEFIAKMLKATPYLPVIAVPSAEDAVPLAQALQKGDINNIEVTLRTPDALESIKRIKAECPTMMVGVGTVFTAEQVYQAAPLGAQYIVSPGFSETVHQACLKANVPYLPGAVTPTEIQTLQEKGFRVLKFFPAEASGGAGMLKALAPVFKDMAFCATGGITAENMKDYLALPNVVAVGLSSMISADKLKAKDWAGIAVNLKDYTV